MTAEASDQTGHGKGCGRTLLSTAVVACVATSWACATQFSKSALSIDPTRFYAPYSMVWFSTTFMIICYPIYLLYATVSARQSLSECHRDACLVFDRDGLHVASVLKRVLPFLCMWVAANYSYSYALGHISASAASSIMSANTAVVCLLAFVILHSVPSVVKIIGALLAIGGVVVISMDKEFAGSLLGVGLVVFSAISAAFYKVLFKRVNGDANLGQVSLFMSMLGVLDALLNVWPAVVLVATDVDHIEVEAVPWWPLVGAALLGLVFNFLVNFGIALLNPLVISVGMLFGIPLSAAIDILFRDMQASWPFIAGSLIFILSFVLSTFPIEEWLCSTRKSESNDGPTPIDVA